MLHEGVTTGQAAKYISRHPKTLQAMDRAGVVPARRTASGRRNWLQPDLDRYLGRTAGERPRRPGWYWRGSFPAQRPELKKQRASVGELPLDESNGNPEVIGGTGRDPHGPPPPVTGVGG